MRSYGKSAPNEERLSSEDAKAGQTVASLAPLSNEASGMQCYFPLPDLAGLEPTRETTAVHLSNRVFDATACLLWVRVTVTRHPVVVTKVVGNLLSRVKKWEAVGQILGGVICLPESLKG